MRPIHAVQVGCSHAVFACAADAEPVARQAAYAEALHRLAPGSTITNVVLEAPAGAQPFTAGRAAFVPVRGPRWLAALRLLPALIRLHRMHPIDVLTAQSVFDEGLLCLAFCRLRAVPAVGQIHYEILHPEAFRSSLPSRLRSWAGMRGLAAWRSLRCVGHGTAAALRARGGLREIAVAPVPMAMLQGPPPPTPPAPSRPRILWVGRLEEQKDPLFFVEAAAQALRLRPDLEFRMVGGGHLRERCAAAAARLGLGERLQLAGRVPSEAMPGEYRSSSVLAITSRFEGFCRVAGEAIGHGVPVVATAFDDAPRIVAASGGGSIVAGRDAAVFAAELVRALDAFPATRMAAAAAAVRADLDPARLTADWVGVLAAASHRA